MRREMFRLPGRCFKGRCYLKLISVALTFIFLFLGSVSLPWGGVASETTQPGQTTALAGTNEKTVTTTGLEVPSGVRVIIFSPHPDDETLAAGGLIQRVLENGGKVRVVFMTNGDGYLDGVRKVSGQAGLLAADFVHYGVTRQEEALKAVSHLGLKQRGALFLGFPDQGLDHLWKYWSRFKPYTSPYTHFDHPRYRSSYMRLKYDGRDLETEIERIMNNFRPDWVIIPDPRDFHPDHAATGLFVLDSLRRFESDGRISLQKISIFSYLVHYKDYPGPGEWRKLIETTGIGGSDIAAKELSGSQWLDFSMTPEELSRKKLALGSYTTQWEVLGGLLRQFIRPVETFSRLTPAQVIEVPTAYERRLGRFPNAPLSRRS